MKFLEVFEKNDRVNVIVELDDKGHTWTGIVWDSYDKYVQGVEARNKVLTDTYKAADKVYNIAHENWKNLKVEKGKEKPAEPQAPKEPPLEEVLSETAYYTKVKEEAVELAKQQVIPGTKEEKKVLDFGEEI